MLQILAKERQIAFKFLDDLKQIALGDILARAYNMSQTGTGEKGLGQNKLLFNKLILVFASSTLCR